MIKSVRCISLRVVKHNDKNAVVTCLSREVGRVALLIPDGSGKGARRLRALTMPGSEFECLLNDKGAGDLHRISDVMPLRPILVDNPAKYSVVIFMMDFLGGVVREQQADDALYDYVNRWVDDVMRVEKGLGMVPIAFLSGLAQFLGVMPDVASWQQGYVFDIRGGIFRPTPPLDGEWLSPDEAAVIPLLERINLRNLHIWRFDHSARRRILDNLIKYYRTHFGSIGQLQSLDVVRALFD